MNKTAIRSGPFVAVRYMRVPPGIWAALSMTELEYAQQFESSPKLPGCITDLIDKTHFSNFGRYCLVQKVDLPKLRPEESHELCAALTLKFGEEVQDPDERSAFFERIALMFMEKAKDGL